MGNDGDPQAVDNIIGESEEARVYAEDASNAGAFIALKTEGGSLRTVSASQSGNKLTDALGDEAADEYRVRVFGLDGTGSLQEGQVEDLSTELAAGTFGQVTYLARALNSQSIDEFVTRVTDSTGTQVDPATESTLASVLGRDLSEVSGVNSANFTNQPISGDWRWKVDIEANNAGTLSVSDQTDYPNIQTVGHDLVGTGDLTIGPVPVDRSAAAVVSATSTDGNTFSASVEWQDTNGNVFQSESSTDIGLDAVTEDWARLVRKGPQVSVTLTDESGAAQNNVNVHVDTEK